MMYYKEKQELFYEKCSTIEFPYNIPVLFFSTSRDFFAHEAFTYNSVLNTNENTMDVQASCRDCVCRKLMSYLLYTARANTASDMTRAKSPTRKANNQVIQPAT